MRAVAVNVGANTNEPGFRGPVHPDGRFRFVPIPESRPVREDATVPTYGDLGLDVEGVSGVADRPVHLDPEFAGYGPAEAYTYGDPYGVKARPILDLDAGDHLLFYATLDLRGEGPAPWITPGWGAYLIGRFELARKPLSGETFEALGPAKRAAFAGNAHCRRETFDAAVIVEGDPGASGLLSRAVPLSGAEGVEPNRLVTEWSADSGRGPWWRRPLRFDAEATADLIGLEGATDDELVEVTRPR